MLRTRDPQPYSDNQDRFDSFAQVLCREALSGSRFYWEIEWSGEFSIGVAYRGISRKGKGSLCLLGYNDKSWSLLCSDTGYSAWHNRVDKAVSGPHSSRIGVFLDHSAGVLAFYSIGETMTRLYRFETTFTEPLYPGFGVGTSVKICQLKWTLHEMCDFHEESDVKDRHLCSFFLWFCIFNFYSECHFSAVVSIFTGSGRIKKLFSNDPMCKQCSLKSRFKWRKMFFS